MTDRLLNARKHRFRAAVGAVVAIAACFAWFAMMASPRSCMTGIYGAVLRDGTGSVTVISEFDVGEAKWNALQADPQYLGEISIHGSASRSVSHLLVWESRFIGMFENWRLAPTQSERLDAINRHLSSIIKDRDAVPFEMPEQFVRANLPLGRAGIRRLAWGPTLISLGAAGVTLGSFGFAVVSAMACIRLRPWRSNPERCWRCGYSLNGLAPGQPCCPECGEARERVSAASTE